MRSKSSILIALLVSACGSATDEQAAAPQQQRVGRDGPGADAADAAGVRLALLEPSADSDAAALDGYLHVEGRCLYVRDRSGAKAQPAFLIADARWDEQRGVLVAHGRSYRPGQHVRLGGSTATDPSLLRWVQPPDPSCSNSGLFVTGTIEPLPEENSR